MSVAPGKDAKAQVNGTSGGFTVLSLARSVDFSIEPNLLETTSFGDDSPSRTPGLVGASISFEFLLDDTDPDAQTDLEDSALNGTEVDVEYSPDRNASTLTVYDFTVLVSSYSAGTEVDSENAVSVDAEISDGTTPSVSASFT